VTITSSLIFSKRGRNFKDDDDVKSAVDHFFSSQNADFYSAGIDALPQRWQRVLDACGAYIE
jgi:hypothetical protein